MTCKVLLSVVSSSHCRLLQLMGRILQLTWCFPLLVGLRKRMNLPPLSPPHPHPPPLHTSLQQNPPTLSPAVMLPPLPFHLHRVRQQLLLLLLLHPPAPQQMLLRPPAQSQMEPNLDNNRPMLALLTLCLLGKQSSSSLQHKLLTTVYSIVYIVPQCC